MARRVVVHVGTMKSGTSYLQSMLWDNKGVLAEQGVLLPTEGFGKQWRAVQDVLGHRATTRSWGAWDALVDEVNAWEGTAVISVEILAFNGPQRAAWVVGSFPDAEVEIVVTARDLNRTLSAMWQETIQYGRSWSRETFLAETEATRPRRFGRHRRPEEADAGDTFWRHQDLVRIARIWGDAAGGNLTLVTVPPAGSASEVLLRRFARTVGFDAGLLEERQRANESIGGASLAVLQELNAALDARGLPYPAAGRIRKSILAKQIMAEHRTEEARLGLPVDPWVTRHSRRTVGRLRRAVRRIEGEWSDLEPAAVTGVLPQDITVEQQAAAADFAAMILRRRLTRRLRRLTELAPLPPERPRGGTPREALTAAVAELADLVAWDAEHEADQEDERG